MFKMFSAIKFRREAKNDEKVAQSPMGGLAQNAKTNTKPNDIARNMAAASASMGALGSTYYLTQPPEMSSRVLQDACQPIPTALYDNPMSMGFAGYPRLIELSQMQEIYAACSAIALDATRRGVEITGDNQDDVDAVIARIRIDELMQVAHDAILMDGLYGGALVVVDGGVDLSLPAIWRTYRNQTKLKYKTIAPYWCSPQEYNSSNPLANDWYRPSKWSVNGRSIHAKHTVAITARPVSDMLKPSYNMFGISLSQIMADYVRRWRQTAESVSDMIKSYSISGIKTDMLSQLADAQSLIQRATLFNRTRDNRGLLMLDKDTEEFFQFSAPLSGLGELLQKSQEQMSAAAQIPLVKLLGITPSGLNASSQGEMMAYYDYIAGIQRKTLIPIVRKAVDIACWQLGIDNNSIDIELLPLWQMTDKEQAEIREMDSRTHLNYASAGAVDATDIRQAIDASGDYNYPLDDNEGYDHDDQD